MWMRNINFDLAAELETLRATDSTALNELLLEFAAAGNVGGVDAVLTAGADLETQDSNGRTPLQWPSGRPPAVVEQLIGWDLGAANDGWTPLHVAALNDHTATVELLIAEGADIEAKNCFGCTALHVAALNDHTATIEPLRRAICVRLVTLFARRRRGSSTVEKHFEKGLHCHDE